MGVVFPLAWRRLRSTRRGCVDCKTRPDVVPERSRVVVCSMTKASVFSCSEQCPFGVQPQRPVLQTKHYKSAAHEKIPEAFNTITLQSLPELLGQCIRFRPQLDLVLSIDLPSLTQPPTLCLAVHEERTDGLRLGGSARQHGACCASPQRCHSSAQVGSPPEHWERSLHAKATLP